MEKKQAQDFISDIFQSKFDHEQFTLLVRNLLNNFEHRDNTYQGGSLWEAYREHISQYRRIGKYTDPNGDALDILIVEVKSLSKLDRARTSLRNFVVKHLKTFEKDYALAAFYSKEDGGKDWRFSFVKIETESERTVSGKIKARKELTPAKRYSFLVGMYENSYTAQKQLLPLLQNDYSNPTIEDIENAFSIEKVTDEFFEQYKELYLKLSENKDLTSVIQNVGLEPVRFTKKLLGQIVFLYFLQKKGWLGVPKNEPWGKGEKKYMQKLYDEAFNSGKNYFKDYLQYLFYEALAKDRRDTADPVYYRRFDCKIPFLNGGLFEADYEWEETNIVIPNSLFRNEEKNKAGDKGTGILDVFDRYNFTIKEDEPLEKEVAVDPEMLGKVFENMLEIKERKSKGAFYTPREIVHYMCQESLINYLDSSVNEYAGAFQPVNSNQLNMFGGSHDKKGQMNLEVEHKNIRVPKEDIETFIRKGYLAVENDQNVKAKGHETGTYKFQLPASIQEHANLIDEKLTSIKICDPAIGSGAFPVGLLHELVLAQKVLLPYLDKTYISKKLKLIDLKPEEFEHDKERYIYKIKRHSIQESIYGVDIDASAIDIARLRLWLSLIVDEEDFFNIEALPNLDYKIVQGNSLIGLPDTAMRDLAVEKELEDLKEKFFNQTNDEKKKLLRQEINQKIRQLLDSAEQFAGYKIEFDFKLIFSEVWHHKSGFDIVIGNPPYLNLTKNNFDNNQLILFNKNYYVLKNAQSKNLFALFIELGHKLLGSASTISMIVPEGLAHTRSYSDVRKLFKKSKLNKILTFKNFVFEHAVIGNVVFFTNVNYSDVTVLNFISESLQTFRNKFSHSNILETSELLWPINPDNPIIEKISNGSKLLKDLDYEFSKGMVVKDRSKVLKNSPYLNSLPFLLGKNIDRFKLSYSQYVNYDEITVVGGTSKLEKHIAVPRILIRRTGDEICAAYSTNPELIESTLYMMRGPHLKYMLGILNSSVLTYYLKVNFITNQQGFPQVLLNDLILLPIKYAENKHCFEIFVDYLIFLSSKKEEYRIVYSFFYYLIDATTFETYFINEIKAANKEIIKHLGNLQPINDNMSDEEKLAIIQAEFNRLYDPNHPVRNNLETLDSVEEVRIIKEALK